MSRSIAEKSWPRRILSPSSLRVCRFVNPTVSSDDDADETGELRSVDDDAGDNDGTESTLSILEQWERINVAVMVAGREERKAQFKRFRAQMKRNSVQEGRSLVKIIMRKSRSPVKPQ